MISSQVIQKTLDELRMITRIDLCVMDIDGKVNSTTFATEEEDFGDVRAFAESMADSQVMKGCHFFKIYDNLHDWPCGSSGDSEPDCGLQRAF